jgi:Ca-activated chloride channel family protein
MRPLATAIALLLSLAAARDAGAQWTPPHASGIVPQARPVLRPGGGVEVAAVDVDVAVVDQVATTTLDVTLRNPSASRLESELLVPVPPDAVVRGFEYQGASRGARTEVLPADEARRLYDGIVRRERDPALLEFIGTSLVRSSVFPVEAGGGQRVRLVYEHLLAAEAGRVDYVIPRTESLEYRVPWTVRVRIRARRAVSTVYSPTHPFRSTRLGPGELVLDLEPRGATVPGPVRVSYLLGGDELAATVFAYPEVGGEAGYFLLVAGLPVGGAPPVVPPREVTLVIDRSGSMREPTWSQVLAATGEVLGSLRPGERFAVVAYGNEVETFSDAPVPAEPGNVRRAVEWVRGHGPRGGTNLHEALATALAQPATPGALPLVLFLTDGVPTVGETREAAIVALASRANPARRRIFTYGIGAEPNTALLERIAWESRAAATFVLPGDDVRERMVSSFRRLGIPALASPVLRAEGAAVEDVLPARLPDLFDGDQVVLAGRYRGRGPLVFEIEGRDGGGPRRFRFTSEIAGATARNGFVPRLWAQRKIADLLDRIRYAGADPGADAQRTVAALAGEVVRLSREFGILTEYTAFFAREGVDLGVPDAGAAEARRALGEKALRVRSGPGSVAQDANRLAKKSAGWVDPRNAALDEKLEVVEARSVNQVGDLAFYRQGRRWIDARLLGAGAARPPRVVTSGTAEHARVADRLARDGRQGALALRGEVLVLVDGEAVALVNEPATRKENP